jgi:tRNA(fMet)-specific endonuclease VapC
MLIAAHALDAKAVLVTSDRAFNLVAGLELEDWTQPPH